MADISKITLPNNNQYDIKDNIAREQIENLQMDLTPTVTISSQSPITIANNSISNLERRLISRQGRIVLIDIAFTVSTVITESEAVLFTGCPNSFMVNTRFTLMNILDPSNSAVLCITTDGKIINQWTRNGIAKGVYQGQFIYFTNP